MYTKYVGACLMGIALGLKMKSGLEVEELMLGEESFSPANEPTFILA